MSEFPELSRLPKQQEYWDRLEARITSELSPAVRSLSLTPTLTLTLNWWAPLARRAWWLGGLAAAAGIAALFLVPPRAPAPTSPVSPSGLLRMPDNPATLAFVSASAPPRLASLMLPPNPTRRAP